MVLLHVNPEVPDRPPYLVQEFPPMRHYQHTLFIICELCIMNYELFDYFRHQHRLPCSCRHLHHHAPVLAPSLFQPVYHLLLVVPEGIILHDFRNYLFPLVHALLFVTLRQ